MIYVWGLITSLNKNDAEKVLVPRRVKIPSKSSPKQVSTAKHSFYVLLENGEIFSWGKNKYGRLGHGTEKEFEHIEKPKKIEKLKNINIQKIFSQNWSAGAIDNNNNGYIWGYCSNNSNGLPEMIKDIKIKKLSFGGDFVMILSVDNKLYAMGKNDKYQCGIKNGNDSINIPTLVFDDKRFIDVSCGYKNAMALTEEGYVISWGDNSCGQLGDGKKSKRRSPKSVKLPENKKFIGVSCSLSDKYCHAAAVSENNELYIWGSNYKGKLGNGNTDEKLLPMLNVNINNVKKVICGGIHTMCLDNLGNLFSFGCGSDGRLGHPEAKGHRYLYKEYIPRVIDPLKNRVVDASTSYYAAIAFVRSMK